ncbi:hypothetical protein J6590_077757 [Homalodisca vitripennis]|nr:hypothetical protein J6590_077757 [Homalodisca vitripennis]
MVNLTLFLKLQEYNEDARLADNKCESCRELIVSEKSVDWLETYPDIRKIFLGTSLQVFLKIMGETLCNTEYDLQRYREE